MTAVVAAFNQEKALVGAFSVIVQPVVEPMDRFTALPRTVQRLQLPSSQATTLAPGLVSAVPLHRDNAGVRHRLVTCHDTCHYISHVSRVQIVLRSDAELHLSRYVAQQRGGQCGSTITDLEVVTSRVTCHV